jgi:hypothetical protein
MSAVRASVPAPSVGTSLGPRSQLGACWVPSAYTCPWAPASQTFVPMPMVRYNGSFNSGESCPAEE